MQAEVDVPVTVKTRIGIDDQDNDEFLRASSTLLRQRAVKVRRARSNRDSRRSEPEAKPHVPPLNYDRVYRLKQRTPGARNRP